MTSVPPTQPPAADETDIRLTHDESEVLADAFVAANRAEFMDTDFDVPILRAVERIVAERVRVVEGERDAARAEAAHRSDVVLHQQARTESAEAAHRALRAAVEALTWRPAVLDTVSGKTYPPRRRVHVRVREIDSLLAGGEER